MINSKFNRPTIRDVAREAGVSYQTVSRVLNKQPRVSADTRRRVLAAIDKLGYQRNLAAQMLTTHRSQTIQVIAVDTKFSMSIHAMTRTAKEAGYMPIYVECTKESLAETFDVAAARLVDGIYLYAPGLFIEDNELVRLSHGIPFVRRDYVPDSQLTWVGFDQRHSSDLLMQHLLDLGHTDIAEVSGSMDLINPRLRHEAYVAALIDRGLEPGPSVEGDYITIELAMKTGYEGTCELIRSGDTFTALVLGNDYMAVGALHALREHRVRVPEDMSVVSFDDTPHAQYMAPPLTVIHTDFDLQDKLAFEYLFERMATPDVKHVQHVLKPELIVRESTAPVTNHDSIAVP